MKILIFIIAIAGIMILSIAAVHASISDVKYPVTEIGNCNSQSECETYCNEPSHMEACLNFGEKYGLMSADELAEARKVMPLILSGESPGGCKNKNECEAYCNDESHLNECMEFARSAGLMSDEEYQMAKKTGGKGPGGCKGKKECEDYCNVEANFPTCVDFAVANGLMPAEEAEMAKKTGGKGPGGCKSREECDAFCKNPDNEETCMNFGIEHGTIPAEDLANMKKNQEFMNSAEGQCQTQCLKDAGLDSKSCGEGGGGPSACKECADKCFNHENTKCLNKEKWEQLDADCKSKGSGYHLEEVRGDDGYGKECVVDETCVYSSGEEWESQAEKDRKLAEMQKQWAEEEAQHEAQYGPGSQQGGGGSSEGGGSGGCTQPGPEGQCNPGPGAGPGPSSDGGTAGTGDGGGSSDSSNSGGSSGSGGGESAPVTGGAVGVNSDNWIAKFIKWIFRM